MCAQRRLRLTRAFVVHCLHTVIPVLAISKMSRLNLASVTEQASLSLTWSQTPKTGFWRQVSRGMAHLILVMVNGFGTSFAFENQQNGLCTLQILGSAWASAQSVQGLRCPHELSYSLSAQWRLWSDWADALIRLCGCAGWSTALLFA